MCSQLCFWLRLESFYIFKGKHIRFSSTKEKLLAAPAELGQRLQACWCLAHWRRASKSMFIWRAQHFKRVLPQELQKCASEAGGLARCPDLNITCHEQDIAAEGRRWAHPAATTLLRGMKSSHSTHTASLLWSHVVGELLERVWRNILLWAMHTQSDTT